MTDGPEPIDVLAEATGTHPPSLYRLVRGLGSLGVVREKEHGEFETTAMGRCLATGSPGGLRARAILCGAEWYAAWGELLHSMRTGQTAFDRVHGTAFFDWYAANAAGAAIFDEAMASSTEGVARAVAGTYDFSQCGTIVDVGGGTGALLAAVLQSNPQLRGVLFERPNEVAAAQEFLSAASVADRCDIVAGDFFEGVRDGGDIYLLSWVIHDLDDDRSATILRNCRRAMAKDARLLLVEQVVPPGNEPSLSKLYDLHMLVLAGGCERTEAEFRRLLGSAGLQLARIIPTDVPRSIVEAVPR